GLITNIVRSDGWWQQTYYNNRYVVWRYESFNNANTNSGTAEMRTTSYNYSPFAVNGSGDDGSIDPYIPRNISESVQDKPMGKTWNVILPGERRRYRSFTGIIAFWGDANNLVTITKYFTNGGFSGL